MDNLDKIQKEATNRGIQHIRQYLEYAYAVGYDKGVTYHKNCVKVLAIKDDKEMQFDSIRDAARKLKVKHPSIIKSIKNNSYLKGYKFERL